MIYSFERVTIEHAQNVASVVEWGVAGRMLPTGGSLCVRGFKVDSKRMLELALIMNHLTNLVYEKGKPLVIQIASAKTLLYVWQLFKRRVRCIEIILANGASQTLTDELEAQILRTWRAHFDKD